MGELVDKKRTDVPYDLVLAADCDRYHVLPDEGGRRDQEPGRVERMNLHLDAYRAIHEYRNIKPGTGADWQQKNPDKFAYLAEYEGLNDGVH